MFFSDIEFEERPAADDLQLRQNDVLDVHVGNEHISCDFSYVLEEGEVHVFVLQPCQLEVPVDVCTVGEAIAKIPVVGVSVRRNRHATVRPNAY